MYVSSFNPSSELETLKTSFNFHLPSFFRFGPGLPLCLSPCTGPFFRGRSELGLLSQLVGQAYEKMLIGGFPNWFSQLVDVNWGIYHSAFEDCRQKSQLLPFLVKVIFWYVCTVHIFFVHPPEPWELLHPKKHGPLQYNWFFLKPTKKSWKKKTKRQDC